jgi:hypothetical protein
MLRYITYLFDTTTVQSKKMDDDDDDDDEDMIDVLVNMMTAKDEGAKEEDDKKVKGKEQQEGFMGLFAEGGEKKEGKVSGHVYRCIHVYVRVITRQFEAVFKRASI